MQRFFFTDEVISDCSFIVTGDKADHISKVLRMSVGEKAVFCDGRFDSVCRITAVSKSSVCFEIESTVENDTEPNVDITVYQCLPKGEKMDEMVKRCVQFGATKIVPVLSRRCVSRPDRKSFGKKVERWNKIALSSAMQSMRGRVPRVEEIIDYAQAIERMKSYGRAFVCYELENRNSLEGGFSGVKDVAFLIGPEGGLDEAEALFAEQSGVQCVSLGKRILRTEDAAAFLIPIILYASGDLYRSAGKELI